MQSIDTLTLTFKQNSLKEDSYLKTKQTPISPCRLQAAKTLSAFALFPSLKIQIRVGRCIGMPVIPELGKPRQEGGKFKASLIFS